MAIDNIPIENDGFLKINKITSVKYLNLSEDFECDSPFWTLILIENGEAVVKVSQKSFNLKRNSIFILSPKKSFSIHKKESPSCKIYIISFKTSSKAINKLANERIIIHKKNEYFLPLIFREIKEAYNLKINKELVDFKTINKAFIGAYQVIRIYIQQLFILAFNMKSDIRVSALNPSLDSELITSVVEILKCNIRQNLTSKEICKKTNYSYSVINNIFKDKYGYSVYEYFLILKIEEAKKLLRESRYNITQISDELGFNEPQYFSKVFKRITGMYPKEYPAKIKIDSIVRDETYE